ncbi:MAG TPA: hypothetical protein VEK08_20655 [Planctomycetota bacterium]|nr:hypothetical protein [Planctomycetota bacterium]
MANTKLRKRVQELEREVALLKAIAAKQQLIKAPDQQGPTGTWLDSVWGAFNDAPKEFKEAMRLGREYREAQRRKPTKKRNVRTRHRSV